MKKEAVGVRNLFRAVAETESIPYSNERFQLPLEYGIYSVPWLRRNQFRTPTKDFNSFYSSNLRRCQALDSIQ
jgi:hypothetical protein